MVGLYIGQPSGNVALEAMGTDAIPEESSSVLGSVFGQTLTDNPTARLARTIGADWRTPAGNVDPFRFPALDSADYGEPPSPPADLLSAEKATEKFGIKGRLNFDAPISETVARSISEHKRDELVRQDVIDRREGGIGTGGVARFGVGVLAGLLDPLNVAASFVPVVAPARMAQWLTEAGGAVARTGVRAGVGAAEGAVGTALLEPLNYLLARREHDDVGMGDSLLNIAMGSVLGGGLHVIGGAVADRVTGKYANPVTQRIEAAGPDGREALFRGAVAAVAEGRPVDVAPALNAMEAGRSASERAYDAVPDGPAGEPPLSAPRPAGSPDQAVGGSLADTAGAILRTPEPVGNGHIGASDAPGNGTALPAASAVADEMARRGIVRAQLDAHLASGTVRQAQERADAVQSRIKEQSDRVAELNGRAQDLRASAGAELPAADHLSMVGFDHDTAQIIKDLQSALSDPKLSAPTQAEAERRLIQVVESSRAEIEQARPAIAERATAAEAEARAEQGRLSALERTHAQALGEVDRLAKTAGVQARRVRNIERNSLDALAESQTRRFEQPDDLAAAKMFQSTHRRISAPPRPQLP
ncbi:MAG: hypothetical protein WCF85_20405, partial [Rhodospirillaceae bacterium]